MKYYILEGKEVVACDRDTWGNWFDSIDRHVDLTEIDGIEISTVFLGLDHNYYEGPPHIFETMVFKEPGRDIYCTRCSTWEQAEEMHKKAIDWVNKGCKNDE